MDKLLQSREAGRCLAALFLAFSTLTTAPAATLKEARVTQVVNDVRIVSSDATSHPAAVNETVSAGVTLQTGGGSRAELTFADQIVARLAANTAFSFKDGIRSLNLGEGAVLLSASKKAKGATIHGADVAAVISGTTAMFEHHPGMYKFLVLEGAGRLYRPGHWGDSIVVRAGQVVIGNPRDPLSDPVDFDIARFLKTSRFITEFPPLRSEPLLALESQKQQKAKSKKVLIDTNLVIFGGGTVVSLTDPAQAGAAASPSPAASPATVSSPAPSSEKSASPTAASPPPDQILLSGSSPSDQ